VDPLTTPIGADAIRVDPSPPNRRLINGCAPTCTPIEQIIVPVDGDRDGRHPGKQTFHDPIDDRAPRKGFEKGTVDHCHGRDAGRYPGKSTDNKGRRRVQVEHIRLLLSDQLTKL
jgi:hypothetical protein